MPGAGGLADPSKVPNGAWWTFSSVMMMMLTAGTIYGFSSWNGVLKDKAGYDLSQENLQFLGTMSNAGNYIVLDAGVLNSVFGTHVTFAYGCILTCSGYLALWASVALANGKVPYSLLCIFCLMYGHGCGSIDNAAMTELLPDFPEHKGNVVGCMKCYYGLATASVTIVYNAIFQPDQKGFLVFLGIYSGVSGLVFVPVIRHCRGRIQESADWIMRKFKILAFMLIFFTLYILVVNTLKSEINDMPQSGKPLWIAILVSVIIGMCSLFLLARGTGIVVATSEEAALTASQTAAAAHGPDSTNGSSTVQAGETRNLTVPQMIQTADFWVLMIVLVIGQGSGLLYINNSSQILQAYSPDCTAALCDVDVTSYSALISCFNGLGRLVCGNVSEVLLPKMSRIWFLILCCALLSLSYWMVYFFGNPVLWPAAAIVGAAYGGLWGVQPVILTEIFGPIQYGVKYACSAIAAFAGSLLFATLLAGKLYDVEAKKLGDGNDCFSPACYNLISLITACCGIVAVVIGLGLHMMTKSIYAQIAERLVAT